MQSRRISLVVSNGDRRDPAPVRRQMSLPPAPGRRALRHDPRHGLRTLNPDAVRARLTEGWPGLMLRRFDSDRACAEFFGRSRQAASNWRNGTCRPDAAALALAWLRWPEDCAAICGGW